MTWKLANWSEAISTLFRLGRIGSMPGTMTSLITAGIFALSGADVPLSIVVLIALLGCVSSDHYIRFAGDDVRKYIVIDSAAGYLVSVYGLGITDSVIAFFLFRIFAVVKPFPVNQAEKLPRGVGVMAGPLSAGMMTNVIIRAIRFYFLGGVVIGQV